jgi:hypothetical protein
MITRYIAPNPYSPLMDIWGMISPSVDPHGVVIEPVSYPCYTNVNSALMECCGPFCIALYGAKKCLQE